MTRHFQHDCDRCTYLGSIDLREEQGLDERAQRYADAYQGKYDLYHCDQGGPGPTLIARYGDDGPEYMSGIVFAKPDMNYPLYRALEIAKEKGLDVNGW
jgi:hypothetical protein